MTKALKQLQDLMLRVAPGEYQDSRVPRALHTANISMYL